MDYLHVQADNPWYNYYLVCYEYELKSPFNQAYIPVLSKTSNLYITRGAEGDEALSMTVKIDQGQLRLII